MSLSQLMNDSSVSVVAMTARDRMNNHVVRFVKVTQLCALSLSPSVAYNAVQSRSPSFQHLPPCRQALLLLPTGTVAGKNSRETRSDSLSLCQRCHRVAVLGAAGGIGQPMSLLLKQSTVVGQLALYDIVGTPGVAADLSHIETQSSVGFSTV